MLRHYTSHAAVKVSQATVGPAATHAVRDRRLALSASKWLTLSVSKRLALSAVEGLALSAPNG
jgi:hypothetical protein